MNISSIGKRILVLSLAVGVFGGAVNAVATKRSCQTSCYRAKTRAYRECRAIAPSKRTQRKACFAEADMQLKKCLQTCTK